MKKIGYVCLIAFLAHSAAACAMETDETEVLNEKSKENEGYIPPDNGAPDRTQGSGTRALDESKSNEKQDGYIPPDNGAPDRTQGSGTR